MRELLPFLVVGLGTGSVYAVAALGLVLTYKTSGVFNFAHGAVAAVGAYLFNDLWQMHGVPWPLALVLVVGVLAPLGGLLLERLARLLSRVPIATRIVATVALLVALQGLLSLRYGAVALEAPVFLPTGSVTIAGAVVGADVFITMVLALVSAGGLAVFFARTRTGRAMRAVVDDEALLSLTGMSPSRVRITAWVIGAAFGALSGILIAPSLGLDAVLLTLLVVQAFGAAAVGAFGSLPLTYVGGLVVGIGAAVSRKYVGEVPALAGFPASFPFLVLFAVLLFIPAGRLVQQPDVLARPRPPLPIPVRTKAGLAGAGAVVLALLPFVVGTKLTPFNNGLIYSLIFASLALLVRTSGQVSLCHIAFCAVGATTFAHAVDAGLPWLLAMLVAGLVTVPIGALVAIPAIRLSRLYLALATLGFGILLERLFYGTRFMFGSAGVLEVPRPSFAEGDRAYYWFTLTVVLLGIGLVVAVTRARLGRLLQALADSPTAVTTMGADVRISRLLVLCISAFLAGIAGALLGGLSTSVGSVGFNGFVSLTLLPVLFLAGPSQVLSPFVAAAALTILPTYLGEGFTELQPVLFGVATIVLVALEAKGGDGGSRVQKAVQDALPRMRHRVLQERVRRATPALR